MSSVATIAAVTTAVVAVAGTAYTMISSSSRQSSGGGAAQPVTMPDTPATVEPAAEEPVPEKETTAESLQAAPDAARGVQGTVMTGGLGDTSETRTKKKTLLGS